MVTGTHIGAYVELRDGANRIRPWQEGSWDSEYGSFFLSWYSGELVSHGDRMLRCARSVFDHTGWGPGIYSLYPPAGTTPQPHHPTTPAPQHPSTVMPCRPRRWAQRRQATPVPVAPPVSAW